MKTTLAISLAINAVLVIGLLIRIPVVTGGGQYAANGNLTAQASSLNDTNPFNEERVYYEFTVEPTAGGARVARVRFEYAEGVDNMAMREYPQVVTWSDDGSRVTFTTPEIDVILKNVQAESGPPGRWGM